MSDKLKPCPFCGNEAEISINKTNKGQISVITCSKCSCRKTLLKYSFYDGDIEEDIIELWNRRAGVVTIQEPELDIEIIALLLSKCLELFKRQDESPYVLNLLEEIVHYDGVNCDGYCLMEDIENALEDMRGEQE